MKITAVSLCTLGAVSAFSNNALPTKTAFAPLSMLPQKKAMESSSSGFYPFEESSSALMMGSDSPNQEADDGSSGVRQLLGLKGAGETDDIWKIRLQLTKVRLLISLIACSPPPQPPSLRQTYTTHMLINLHSLLNSSYSQSLGFLLYGV